MLNIVRIGPTQPRSVACRVVLIGNRPRRGDARPCLRYAGDAFGCVEGVGECVPGRIGNLRRAAGKGLSGLDAMMDEADKEKRKR